jgi:transcription termination factor NusB
VRVSIDEAIELAKTYSTEQSYAFINGILDAIVRQKGLPL